MVSKVLPKFLSALSSIPSPVLLNLGPVIGQNVSFFGEQLSCKIFVEDLDNDINTLGGPGPVAEAIEARIRHAPESIDGILCWDAFDFLDRKTSQALAARLVSVLRPGGVVYGFFGTKPEDVAYRSRFVVESRTALRVKRVPAVRRARTVLVTRDINKIFAGLDVADSVLLKMATRETLFRKLSV